MEVMQVFTHLGNGEHIGDWGRRETGEGRAKRITGQKRDVGEEREWGIREMGEVG